MFILTPKGLITTDPSHPVPVVVVFPDGCAHSFYSPGPSCFTGSTTNVDNGVPDYLNIAAQDRFIEVVIFADCCVSGGAYYDPTLYGSPTALSVGSAQYDQALETADALTFLKSRFAIDASMVFAAGGSKGGAQVNELMCSTETESLFSGLAGGSTIIFTNGMSGPPQEGPPSAKGSCPALLQPGTFTPVSTHPLMMMHWFSPNDSAYLCYNAPGTDGVPPNGKCLDGGGNRGTAAAPRNWIFSQDEVATKIDNPAFGCTSAQLSTSAFSNNEIVHTWDDCHANSANKVENQVIALIAGGCHSFRCSHQSYGFDVARASWEFWTTGTTLPS